MGDKTDEDIIFDETEEELSTPVSKSKRKKPKVATEWTDEDTFKLISCVEVHEQLWNAQYRNKTERTSIWQTISQVDFENRFNEHDLLAKWTNIRIQFRGYAAKAKKTKSGQGSSSATLWKFFSAMQFIDEAEEDQSSHCESNLSFTPTESSNDIGDLDSVSTVGASTSRAKSTTVASTASSSSAAHMVADSMKEAVNMLKKRQLDSDDKNAAFAKYLWTELRSMSEQDAAYIRNKLTRKFLDCVDELQKMNEQVVYVVDQNNE